MFLRSLLLILAILVGAPAVARAQLGLTYTSFNPGQTISSAQFTSNFTNISSKALNREGGIMIGHLLFSPDNTYDVGADGASRPRDVHVGRNVKIGGDLTVTGDVDGADFVVDSVTSSGPISGTTLSGTTLTLSGTSATAISVAGGITAGSGNVAIVGVDGRIPALTSTYFASLSGASLTNIPETAITDGSVFPRLAGNETITGSWTFIAQPTISNISPILNFIETGVAVNEGRWRFVADAGTFNLQAMTDAGAPGSTAFQVSRSGATVTSVLIPAPLSTQALAATTGTFSGTVTAPTVSVSGAFNANTLGVGSNANIGGTLTAGGAVLFNNTVTTTISSTANNYNPTGLSAATMLRISSSDGLNKTIGGIAGGTSGRLLTLCNVGTSGSLLLVDESGGSTAQNRFAFEDNVNVDPQVCILLVYDGLSSRWRLVNVT